MKIFFGTPPDKNMVKLIFKYRLRVLLSYFSLISEDQSYGLMDRFEEIKDGM